MPSLSDTSESKDNPPFDDALMMVVSTPLTFGGADRMPLLKIIWGYLGIEGLAMLIYIWFRGEGRGSATLVHADDVEPWVLYIAIYVTIGIVFKWTYIIYGEVCDGFTVTVKRGEVWNVLQTVHCAPFLCLYCIDE